MVLVLVFLTNAIIMVWCAQVVFRGTNPESLQDICLNTMAKPTTVGEEGGALAGAEFHTGFLGACTMHKQRVVSSACLYSRVLFCCNCDSTTLG